MGLFKKANDSDLQLLLESFKDIKTAITANFESIVINEKSYSSKQIADMAEKIFILGVQKDDADLRKYALYIPKGINSKLNKEWSAVDRGKLLMLAANNGIELRKKYNDPGSRDVNEYIAIILKALFDTFQESEDWGEVIDATVEYAKIIEDLRTL